MIDARKYRDTVYRIIGAAMTVYDELRGGLLEKVYEEALSIELTDLGIENKCQEEILIYYKNRLMKKRYKMDIVVDDVIVELKSTSKLCSAHRAQICNYLRLTHKPVCVLINFSTKGLQGERWVYDEKSNECYLVDKKMEPLFMDESLFDDGTTYVDE